MRARVSAPPHVVVSAIEHDAVLHPAKRLERQGFRVSYLTPDARGFVSPAALERVIDEDTVLVSVQMANSEVGSIQPVAELARIAHDAGSLFHTDAVQALGKTPVDVSALDVDAASFSAHKIGGPKGVGALYLRTRTPFDAFMLGEVRVGQTQRHAERRGHRRFAAACKAAMANLEEESARLRLLRDRLYAGLAAFGPVSPTVSVEGGSEDFLPNIVHVLVDGLESETMILRLDMAGIGVSGGSACSSHSLEPSHVLKAMGVSGDRAHGALRISMGRYTVDSDVEALLSAMQGVLDWWSRGVSRLAPSGEPRKAKRG